MRVPKPDGVPLERWLLTFPSYGYLLAVRPPQRPGGAGALSCARHRGGGDRRSHSGSARPHRRRRAIETIWDFAREPLIGLRQSRGVCMTRRRCASRSSPIRPIRAVASCMRWNWATRSAASVTRLRSLLRTLRAPVSSATRVCATAGIAAAPVGRNVTDHGRNPRSPIMSGISSARRTGALTSGTPRTAYQAMRSRR